MNTELRVISPAGQARHCCFQSIPPELHYFSPFLLQTNRVLTRCVYDAESWFVQRDTVVEFLTCMFVSLWAPPVKFHPLPPDTHLYSTGVMRTNSTEEERVISMRTKLNRTDSVPLVHRCVDSHITWQAKASCAWLMWRPGELMNTEVMSQRCSESEMPQMWPIDVWVVVFWHQPHDATRLQHDQPPRSHRAGPGSTSAWRCGAEGWQARPGPWERMWARSRTTPQEKLLQANNYTRVRDSRQRLTRASTSFLASMLTWRISSETQTG